MTLFFLALKDFFSYQFFKFTLIPFIISLVCFSLLSYFGFSFLQEWVRGVFSSNSILAWFYSFGIFKMFLDLISFLAAIFAVLYLSVFCALIISSFFSDSLLKLVYKKHYDISSMEGSSFFSIGKISLKVLFKALVLLIICLILLFIPVLNILGFYIFFYYIYANFLLVDVTGSVFKDEDFKAFWKKGGTLSLKVILGVFYIVSCVPILGLISQGFFIIYLGHYFACKDKTSLIS